MKRIENQNEKCISCQKAHDVMKEYLTFYPNYLKYKRNKKLNDSLLKSAERIANILNIQDKQNNEELIEFIASFTNRSNKKNNSQINCECQKEIQGIIRPLKVLLQQKYNDEDDIKVAIDKTSINILFDMQNLLIDNKVIEENSSLTLPLQDEKWHTDYVESLTKKDCKEKYDMFLGVVDTYCNNKRLNFKYGKGNRDCRGEYFLSLVDSLPAKVKMLNYDDLKFEYQQIFENYLIKAPKKFGSILADIMEYQDIKEHFISDMMDKKVSIIQSYLKSDKVNLTEDELKTLARILLVSEDLLICGTGQIYGNWNDIYSVVSKENKDSDDLKTVSDYYKTNSTNEIKSNLKEEIKKLINQSDDDFNNMVSNSDFFDIEDYSVYQYEENDQYYVDFDLMYKTLLNQKEADTLLSVLRDLQNSQE